MCVCAEQAQAVSSPYVFVPENKISVFCHRGVNHALSGVHSLAASPGKSALSPGGAEHRKSRGDSFLLSANSRCATLGMGPGPSVWEALSSPCVLWGHREGWKPLVSVRVWELSGAAGVGIKGGSSAWWVLIFPVLERGLWAHWGAAGYGERQSGAG